MGPKIYPVNPFPFSSLSQKLEKAPWMKLAPEKKERLAALGVFALALAALALWLPALRQVNVREMTDLGLASVLPAASYAGLGLLTVSFGLALRLKRFSTPILLLHLVLLIFMLYGVTTLVEEMPRFEAVYKHVGITEYIQRTHSLNTKLNAYFSWPSFFILSAFFTETLGFQSALSLTPWASVFFNLLYLGALLLILGGLTTDRRLTWLVAWFYFLTNWVGQDTFAPQAMNYFLYLVVLGILIRWFRTSGPESLWRFRRGGDWVRRRLDTLNQYIARADGPVLTYSPLMRVGLLAVILLILAFNISSHQLTPFALLASMTALVVFKRTNLKGLPIIMLLLIATWMAFMTTDFLRGHSDMVVGGVGEVDTAVTANVTNRVEGSPEHLFIVTSRIVMTGVLWGLAFVGLVQRFSKGYLDLTPGILALAPFPLLATAVYGGEMILRVYFLSQPWMAFFAGALFFPTLKSGSSWLKTLGIIVVSTVLLAGFQFTRYGNESMDFFTRDEFEAMEYLYRVAPAGSQLVVGSVNMPWRYQDYEKFKISRIKKDRIRKGEITNIQNIMANKKYPRSYLILSRSQKAHTQLFADINFNTWTRFEKTLLDSNKFQVVFINRDAVIFTLKQGAPQTQEVSP